MKGGLLGGGEAAANKLAHPECVYVYGEVNEGGNAWKMQLFC